MAETPKPSIDRLASEVNDLAHRLAALGLTLLVVESYLLITALSVSHETLLRNSALRLPLIDRVVPLTVFFWTAPVLVLFLHLNLLIQADFLRRRIAALAEASQPLWSYWARILSPAARLGSRRVPLGGAIGWIPLVVLLAPLPTILYLAWVYLPRRSPWSLFHAGVATADLLLLVVVLWVLPRTPSDERFPERLGRLSRGWRPSELLVASLVLAFSGGIWWCALLEPRHLDLRGAVLVQAEPSKELVASLLAKEDSGTDRSAALLAIRRSHAVGMDLSGRDLRNADFRDAELFHAKLRGSDLSGADFTNADLSGADLNPAGAESVPGGVPGAERSHRLSRPDMEDMRRTKLEGTDFRGATLQRAQLMGVIGVGARFDGADMAGSQLAAADLQGASFRGEKTVLVGADLYDAQLDRARFKDADLTGAVLSNADLTGTDFTGARLLAAELSGTDLKLTIFRFADLRSSVWTAARMPILGTDFFAARLQGSSGSLPQGALLDRAQVHGADLCGGSPLHSRAADRSDNRVSLLYLWSIDTMTPDATEGEIADALSTHCHLPLIREAIARREREVKTCFPVSPENFGDFEDDDFFGELARRLIADLCDDGDEDLAIAISNMIARSDPRRRVLSRQLQKEAEDAMKRLDECRHAELLSSLRDATSIPAG